MQSPTITALRGQYAEIMRREAEEMTTLGPRHPAVLDIQAQAERLRHMIDNEIDRTAVASRTEYESAKASEQTIANNLKVLEGNTVDTNQAMVGLRELERDAQASRDIYQAFLVRARETGEQQQIDTKNIRVISKADHAAAPELAAVEPAHRARRAVAGRRHRRRHRSGAAAARRRRRAGKASDDDPWRNRIGRAARPREHGILAGRRRVEDSGARDIAGGRCVVRLERRRRSEIVLRQGHSQNLRRAAGEP